MTTEQTLLKTVESLTKVNEQQSRQIDEMAAELKKMAAQIAWFQQQMFGRKSEKHLPSDNQPNLFDAAGVEIPGGQEAESEAEPEEETVTYKRKKSQKGVSKPRETWENLPLLETPARDPCSGASGRRPEPLPPHRRGSHHTRRLRAGQILPHSGGASQIRSY